MSAGEGRDSSSQAHVRLALSGLSFSTLRAGLKLSLTDESQSVRHAAVELVPAYADEELLRLLRNGSADLAEDLDVTVKARMIEATEAAVELLKTAQMLL